MDAKEIELKNEAMEILKDYNRGNDPLYFLIQAMKSEAAKKYHQVDSDEIELEKEAIEILSKHWLSKKPIDDTILQHLDYVIKAMVEIAKNHQIEKSDGVPLGQPSLIEMPPSRRKHHEMIKCPECKKLQIAIVQHTVPFFTYIHECCECKYTIMESEWDKID